MPIMFTSSKLVHKYEKNTGMYLSVLLVVNLFLITYLYVPLGKCYLLLLVF